MFPPGAILTWAPAFSTALPLARERWRDQGGLLVVPRREDAARALGEAVADGSAALGREAVTFAGLRGRVALAAGVREAEPPSAVAVRLALRAVLDEADLSAFGASAEAPGFLAAVERAVAELRAARVAPARVEAAAATPVARAVAAIHAAAWDAVPMASDALWAAADAARAVARFPAVTVTGFDDLVPGQWALLHALAQATRVEVVMPFDPDRPAFEARRARQERWAAEAGSTGREGAPAGAATRASRRGSSTRCRRPPTRRRCAWWAPPAHAGCCGPRSTRRSPPSTAGRRWAASPWRCPGSRRCATTSSACSTTGACRRGCPAACACSRPRWRSR